MSRYGCSSCSWIGTLALLCNFLIARAYQLQTLNVQNYAFTRIKCLVEDVHNPGVLIICDHQAIVKLDINSGQINNLAGLTQLSGYADGTGKSVRFHTPKGVIHSEDGSLLYVSDQDNHCIRQVNTITGETSVFVGRCKSSGYFDGNPRDAKFYKPDTVKISPGGKIFVTDRGNNALRQIKLNASGLPYKVTTIINNQDLQGPGSIVFLDENTIIMGSNNKILVIDLKSMTSSVLAGSQTSWPGFKDGSFQESLFHNPLGMAISKDRRYLLVADSFNYRVRALNLDQNHVTSLCTATRGTEDGHYQQCQTNWPKYICNSQKGSNVYYIGEREHVRRLIFGSAHDSELLGDQSTIHIPDLNTGSSLQDTEGDFREDLWLPVTIGSAVVAVLSILALLIIVIIKCAKNQKKDKVEEREHSYEEPGPLTRQNTISSIITNASAIHKTPGSVASYHLENPYETPNLQQGIDDEYIAMNMGNCSRQDRNYAIA